MAKSSSVVLFLVVVVFVEGLQLCFCKNSTIGCIKKERKALLQFNDPLNRLASWTGSDCCQWNGVSCHQNTGHVVKLDLQTPRFYFIESYTEDKWYVAKDYTVKLLSAMKVDSCLVKLKHLRYLDLSGNYFGGSKIPGFFGSLKHLKYLNLSMARFGGRIPVQLGNLSSLQILDLSYQYTYHPQLYADNFRWMSGLLSLEYLDMSWMNLSKALDLIQVLSALPSLIDLRLIGCSILQNMVENIPFSLH